MTDLKVDLRRFNPSLGDVKIAPHQRMTWTPLFRRDEAEYVTLPAEFYLDLVDGVGGVDDLTPLEYWSVREGPYGVKRIVQVPASGVQWYHLLPSIDPKTLLPGPSPLPGWADEVTGLIGLATDAKVSAEDAATGAAESATSAGLAKVAAESARATATNAATAAGASATDAGTSATNAAGSASTATTQAGMASTARTGAETARTGAEVARDTAATYATRFLSGTGSPLGVVAAPVGTKYVDTAGTNGAWEWIKKTGAGNTGWVVTNGDTGWRSISSMSAGSPGSWSGAFIPDPAVLGQFSASAGSVRVRRTTDAVLFDFRTLRLLTASGTAYPPATLPTGWFAPGPQIFGGSLAYNPISILTVSGAIYFSAPAANAALGNNGSAIVSIPAPALGTPWPTSLIGTAG